MGRHKQEGPGEPELRAYLLDWERGFMQQAVSTMMADGVESGQYALDALSPRVDALAEHREVRHIHAWLLPDGHWARKLGLDRNWTLGADDVLREEISTPGPKFVPPGNRAQRRAAGWR